MPNKPRMPRPQRQSRRVGFAVVGLGELSAEEIIPALRTSQHAYLAAVVTAEPDKGRAFAAAAGLKDSDAYTYEQFGELAQRDDVQAVYIVLPNNLHREYVEQAARMGKHVLCEKPLASNTQDAEAIVKACHDAGVKLMVAYRIQYTPHHWAAKHAIAAGKLGAIKLMDSIHTQVEDDPSVWRLNLEQAGGGPLPDVGIYSLNTLRFLTGLEPEWVFAAQYQPTDDPRFKEVEESVSFMLGFPGGLIANCLTSYGADKTTTVRVLGDQGTAVLDPAFPYVGLKLRLIDKKGETTPSFPDYDQFGLEVDHFAQCIQQGKEPYTPGEEGVQDHRLMDAIYESARSGKRVEVKKLSGQDLFRTTGNVPRQLKAGG
ncbi:Gfo/Idh/MocA family oxidoreductase (plasmid) [Deinococcus sp. KNUC1210]|uniref:Gfo/Idh/MocA family protein n=1 Tax=Deinococcus sp. KNUC1210 TaxID=2917691 RepID=UPI001EEFA012|nr:Gfo/Idh/MocA family oxidoreductase [Deinococcus sp. KNUC1210]ULH17113.1 Gfo/Idh/MocA family oxidoreductase [Deinococcus sp. KNUC1210]